MPLDQSINLIPQGEKHEQAKTEAVKLSTVFTIIVMLAVAAISTYFFYQITNLKQESRQLDQRITDSRLQIQSMAPIEITARNLDSRYQTLQEISGQRVLYSKLLQELKSRTPVEVTINDLNVSVDNKMTISGDGDNYISIASFINKLLENKTLFTSVILNSVNLNSSKNRADFFIAVTFNPEALR
jgi:Tfp pilus assembly protein PilN